MVCEKHIYFLSCLNFVHTSCLRCLDHCKGNTLLDIIENMFINFLLKILLNTPTKCPAITLNLLSRSSVFFTWGLTFSDIDSSIKSVGHLVHLWHDRENNFMTDLSHVDNEFLLWSIRFTFEWKQDRLWEWFIVYCFGKNI